MMMSDSAKTDTGIFRDRMERRRAEHYFRFFGPVTVQFFGHIAAMVGAGHGGRAVDLGCGDGRLAELLTDRGWDCVAMDRAAYMAREARSRLGPHRVVIADAATLPLATGSIDAVTAAFLVPHLDDLNATFGEIRRVLRPGGRMCLSTWGTPQQSPFTGLAFELIRTHAAPDRDGVFDDLNHRASLSYLRDRLSTAGFEIADVITAGVEVNAQSPEEWWNGLIRGSIGLSYLLDHCAPSERRTIKKKFVEKASASTVNGRVTTSAQAILVSMRATGGSDQPTRSWPRTSA